MAGNWHDLVSSICEDRTITRFHLSLSPQHDTGWQNIPKALIGRRNMLLFLLQFHIKTKPKIHSCSIFNLKWLQHFMVEEQRTSN